MLTIIGPLPRFNSIQVQGEDCLRTHRFPFHRIQDYAEERRADGNA